MSPAQDTEHLIALGESYTLSFAYAGASGWNLGSDQFTVTLYYLNGSTPVTLTNVTLMSTSLFGAGCANFTATLAPVMNPAAVGKSLLIVLSRSPRPANLPRWTTSRSLCPASGRGGGDYQQLSGGELRLALGGVLTNGVNYGQLLVSGNATLAGTLQVNLTNNFVPAPGQNFVVLSAASVAGRFDNPDSTLTTADGAFFRIGRSATNITLTAVAVTAHDTPYDWLEQSSIAGSDPEKADLMDQDGDGMLAWQEYLAGTNPTNAASVLALQPATPNPASMNLVFSWFSVGGRSYTLEHSPDLSVPFAPRTGLMAVTPPVKTITIPRPSSSTQFYRISVSGKP